MARSVARKHMRRYMVLPNYRNCWLSLGFAEADFDGDGSDRFQDAMVVWGGERQIRDCIEAHQRAGADQVILQAFPSAGGNGADFAALDAFAPG